MQVVARMPAEAKFPERVRRIDGDKSIYSTHAIAYKDVESVLCSRALRDYFCYRCSSARSTETSETIDRVPDRLIRFFMYHFFFPFPRLTYRPTQIKLRGSSASMAGIRAKSLSGLNFNNINKNNIYYLGLMCVL